MLEYRLYFLDNNGAIQAREEFAASDDNVALVVASVVCGACSDLCHAYELWQGSRLVIETTRGAEAIPSDNQIARAQQVVLNLEDSLQRSHWRIARSTKLLEEMERLKSRPGSP